MGLLWLFLVEWVFTRLLEVILAHVRNGDSPFPLAEGNQGLFLVLVLQTPVCGRIERQAAAIALLPHSTKAAWSHLPFWPSCTAGAVSEVEGEFRDNGMYLRLPNSTGGEGRELPLQQLLWQWPAHLCHSIWLNEQLPTQFQPLRGSKTGELA